MSDSIVIPADRFSPHLLAFIANSPLAARTTVGYDGGVQVVRTDLPPGVLSSGEQALWTVLRSLACGDLRTLLVAADSVTTAALADLFARITFDAARDTRQPTGYDAPKVVGA